MVALWIIIVILCLLTTAGGALLALRIQYRSLDTSREEREAWQQAQEGRQRTWEVRQGKHILNAEKKLADQLKEARREWRDWGSQVKQDHQEWRDIVDLETVLASLPHVEEIELAHQAHSGHLRPKDWRPPTFYKADLHGRDLSYRYLERADLREAQLAEATLYMADLTGASLAGANLQRANLIGANLSGADLRGANLSGVNLLVADLHNAVLHGADLTGACNLTPAQLQTAIYDSTTYIDSIIDITLPRIPGVLTTPPDLLAATSTSSQHVETATDAPGVYEENASSTSSELLVANNAPALNAEMTASIPVSSASTENEDAAPLEKNSLPVSTTTREDETDTSVAEVNGDAPASSNENSVTVLESKVSASETHKKNNANRKRASKAKQSTTPAAQTSANKHKETDAETSSENQISVMGEEELDEEEVLPNKIIQLQDRTAKTRPLPASGEQNIDDQPQKKRGNNRTTNFNSSANDSDNQRVHAN